MDEKKVDERMTEEDMAAVAGASLMTLLGGGTDQKVYMDFQDVLGPKTGQGQPVTAFIHVGRGILNAHMGFPTSYFGFSVHSKKDIEGARLLLQEVGEAINKFLSAAHIALDEYEARIEKEQTLADALLKKCAKEKLDPDLPLGGQGTRLFDVDSRGSIPVPGRGAGSASASTENMDKEAGAYAEE